MSSRFLALVLALVLLGGGAAFAQTTPPGQVVQLNGIAMHYQEKGSGEPLLLLHGFGTCGDEWGPIAEALSQRYRVIVPDLRGHGWSTNPANAFTLRQSAEDIAALLDHLGLQRVRAMGISAGGMTLLHLTTSQPERVEAMVLIGTTTYFPEQARAELRGFRWDGMPQEGKDFFLSCAHRGEEQARQLVTQFQAFSASYQDMTFTPPTLGTIRARTLIVHGDRDPFFPVSIPVEMYGAIPGSELWIVPGGDHVPIFDDSTPEFLRVTQRFLSAPSAAEPSH